MSDPTEGVRRFLVAEINAEPGSREALEAEYGKVYSTEELCQHFDVLGFLAPFCIVQERATGKKGSVMFQHMPRFYFDFTPDGR